MSEVEKRSSAKRGSPTRRQMLPTASERPQALQPRETTTPAEAGGVRSTQSQAGSTGAAAFAAIVIGVPLAVGVFAIMAVVILALAGTTPAQLSAAAQNVEPNVVRAVHYAIVALVALLGTVIVDAVGRRFGGRTRNHPERAISRAAKATGVHNRNRGGWTLFNVLLTSALTALAMAGIEWAWSARNEPMLRSVLQVFSILGAVVGAVTLMLPWMLRFLKPR